ncbi:MAG: hypothetical protein KF709_02510 [Gemmatimonadaceae bacterium]|nr:hypothetical protein [Gemmatimonadaceae bacterium]
MRIRGIALLVTLAAAADSATSQDARSWLDRYDNGGRSSGRGADERIAGYHAVSGRAFQAAGARTRGGWPQVVLRALYADTLVEVQVPLGDFAPWLESAIDSFLVASAPKAGRVVPIRLGEPAVDDVHERAFGAARYVRPDSSETVVLFFFDFDDELDFKVEMSPADFVIILGLLADAGDAADDLAAVDRTIPYRTMRERLRRLGAARLHPEE